MRRRQPAAYEREHRKRYQRRKHGPGRFVDMRLLLIKARRAVKGEKQKPEHVQSGEARGENAEPVNHGIGIGAGARGQEDLFLAEETGEARRAGDGQRGHKERGVGPRDALA